jgi:hypothetical protein
MPVQQHMHISKYNQRLMQCYLLLGNGRVVNTLSKYNQRLMQCYLLLGNGRVVNTLKTACYGVG